MTVKEIIIHSFRLLGRQDIVEIISSDRVTDAEINEKLETLLYCYNAVEDELARYYFPLTETERLSSDTGTYLFEDFSRKPVKILSVKAGGKRVNYRLHALYLECAATSVDVEYQYVPDKKKYSSNCEYNGYAVDENLLAAGMLAEYCLISGAVQASQVWESRYREQIDMAQKKHRASLALPPRRWV